MIVNLILRHTKNGDEENEDDYKGFSVEHNNDEYLEYLSEYKMDRVVKDIDISAQFHTLCHFIRLEPENFSDEDNDLLHATCAILRYRLIDNVGEENMSEETISFIDETDVGGDIEIYVLDDDDNVLHEFPYKKSDIA
ncbi:MAG: hypothetical protein HQ474_01655 [Flammeovirgaceae bacterium]|nr:hypothetical protein [Flammeovirgaceae bacterium]